MEYKTYNNLKIPQNLTPEQQAIIDEIAKRHIARDKEINADNLKGMGRIVGGSILSGLSAHPVLNIPYIGTGFGGAMYDAGQAIVEGDNLGDITKRAGRGFAIGETVGALPYVGKLVGKTKAGQAVGEAAQKALNAAAKNPEILRGIRSVRNALQTDIKDIKGNPFKTESDVLYSNPDEYIDLSKYFNNPKLNLKNSFQDAKNFVNEANANEIAFETGSPDFFLDMLGNSKQKGHILRSDKVPLMDDTDKLNHNVIISNFDEVAKGLKPISNKPTPNKKLNDKPNVEDYFYFEGNVKKGDNDIISLIADAEKNFGEPLTKPQKLHLYNIYDKKFSPILNDNTSVKLGETTNIINDINKDFNPVQPEIFYTPQNVEVIKNPTSNMEQTMIKEFKKENPTLNTNGDPILRSTYDTEGNKYVWKSSDSLHEPMEMFLENKTGLKFNQSIDDLNWNYIRQNRELLPLLFDYRTAVENGYRGSFQKYIDNLQK